MAHNEPIRLTRRIRVGVGIFLGMLAVVHVIWPTLAIDAISLGLLGGAGLVAFFNIESLEWHGIRVGQIRRELDKAEKAVEVARPSEVTQPHLEPLAEPIATLASGSPVLVVEPSHRDDLDLNPPVDRLERLLWGAEQIRAELIVIAGNAGVLPDKFGVWHEYYSVPLAEDLAARQMIPPSLASAIRALGRVRNAVVHAPDRIPVDVFESHSSLAMETLIKLREVKREYTRVRQHDVALFKDQSLTARHDAAGVMLARIDNDGNLLSTGVYPRAQNYQQGRFVSWNWAADGNVKGEAWYRDPMTDRVSLAFGESMVFLGREYPLQWGLEYRFGNPNVGLIAK